MDETLKDILINNSFLNPYIKQYKRYLSNNKVIVLGDITNIEKSIIDNNLEIDEIDYSGIIIYEITEEIIDELLNKYYELNKELNIFIIDSNSEYDINLINHLLKNKYDLVEEFIGDDKWKFILYKKNTTN